MQEENYSAAIRQFEKCIELILPKLIPNNHRSQCQLSSYLLFYNRTMLKLGLAHEKRHTDNSAYAIYENLIKTLNYIKQNYNKNELNIFYKNRTFHLGILAQLYTIEKIATTGIEYIDIKKAIKMFYNLLDSKSIIIADFYKKLGDILFYKNQDEDKHKKIFSAQIFYRKSIQMLLKANKHNFFNLAYQFIYQLKNKNFEQKNKKDLINNQKIYNLAQTFESYGHARLSQATIEDKENWHEIEHIIISSTHRPQTINFSESYYYQTLLCYWVASELYTISDERNLSGRCYKQILYVLEAYIKQRKENSSCKILNNNDLTSIKNIADFTIRRLLIAQYREYEHINLAEAIHIKDILKKNQIEQILNFLSLHPDIENLLCAYYHFIIYYCDYRREDCDEIHEQLALFIKQSFHPNPISNSTLTSIVNNHRLCVHIYKYYLKRLLGNDIASPQTIKPKIVAKFLEEGKIYPDISKAMEPMIGKNSKKHFYLLKAILTNAIKHSAKILKMLNPLQTTTLYTNSFRANVYYDFAICQILYNQLKDYYGYKDDKGSEFVTTTYEWDVKNNTIEEKMILEYNELALEQQTKDMQGANFYSNINYLIERALYLYTKAEQCSQQGIGYQELIRNLYFLDDDLNNDTIQFYLAIERTTLSEIEQRKKSLKKHSPYNRAPYYQINNYIHPPKDIILTFTDDGESR